MTTPLPRCELRCPLCGQPNGCVPAQTGTFDTPCWCREVKFTPELLAQVPVAQRDKACICRSCVEKALLNAGEVAGENG